MKIVKKVFCIALALSMVQAVSINSYVSAATNTAATTASTTAATTKITLSKTSAKLVQGKTLTLKATVSTNKKVTWTSSNTKVATVDSSGKVKAVGKGVVNITAKTSDSKSAACMVTVITKNEAYIEDVIRLTNEERAKKGLGKLTGNSRLTTAAQKRAAETAQKLSHTRPNGQSWSTVLKECNVKYTVAGENIAYNYYTAAEAMEGWMDSQGHKANILNAKYKNIGVGLYEKDGVKYCVQLFI